ncbi:hypothetical protein GYA37_02495 [candidate division WWE3 bacterium]|uniref:Uncharacterized protein n=1 Tax=candidate division WWE3 bacterium TaxID=2053526 RepID=A0A7X9E721_UNCKA|nr:hypothetical protein [candidate division WWE3 bacterium]
MVFKDLFLVLSTITSFITPIIGIYSIIKGSFRPQRMTRFLLFLISSLFVGTLLAQHDRNSIFMAVPMLLSTFILFVLSLKKGIGGTERMDVVVFFMTILSLTIWKTTNNPVLGLTMSIITDLTAFLPTLVKTWKFPETEEWKFYMSDVVASTFNILSIKHYTYGSLVFPFYILLINTTSVVMINLRKKALNKSNNITQARV